MARVVRIFLDVDMRCAHHGLQSIASKQKIDLRALDTGEHVVFVNRQKTRLKMISPNAILSYVYQPKGLSLEAIQMIPATFNGKSISYQGALTAAIRKKFPAHRDGTQGNS